MMDRGKLYRGAVIATFVVGISSPIVTSSMGSEPLPAAMLATFKTGTVDAIFESSIKISGTDYRVSTGVKIMDHKEQEIALEGVFLRSEAKFHLNKVGEIDLMVVMRPQ